MLGPPAATGCVCPLGGSGRAYACATTPHASRHCAAHLEGAQQLTLEGCYHSPLGAEDGRALESVQLSSDDGEAAAVAAVEAGAGRQPRLWYGSHSLIDEWVHVVGQPAAEAAGARR